MDATAMPSYKVLEVTGPVSVDKVQQKRKSNGFNVLLMGPTGAGKSSFIEALGLNSAEKISSGRLEGFTQSVSTYRLNNVQYGGKLVYLVDSPGFADTKISEMTIVSMLEKWIRDGGSDHTREFFDCILYLTPVNCVRLPGSQRRVLKTFQEITGISTSDQITITTTMWDMIHGEQAVMRAERTFQQLENDIWKSFLDKGARIDKFHNTQASALSIIDQALVYAYRQESGLHSFEAMVKASKSIQNYTFANNLKADLQDRIQNLQSAHTTALSDLQHAVSQGDMLLQHLLQSQIKESKEDLQSFEKQLYQLDPELLRDRIQQLHSTHATVKADLKHAVKQGNKSLQRLLRSQLKKFEEDLKELKMELHEIEHPGQVSQGFYAIKSWAISFATDLA
ncbi:hypothetical protein BJ165DRAFT_1528606 [Panaeolus papilionaceus]|nr:hypothetical protein BJ165DRAFT_1528606 [Panaeolus papilionaceus]